MCLLLWYGYHFPSSSPTIGPLTRPPCLWALEPSYPCLTESHREVIVLRKFGSRSAGFLQRVYPSDPASTLLKASSSNPIVPGTVRLSRCVYSFQHTWARSSSACERARFPQRKHSMTGCAPPIVAGGSSEKDRSATSYLGRVFFPGNVMPRPECGLGGGGLWLGLVAKCSL